MRYLKNKIFYSVIITVFLLFGRFNAFADPGGLPGGGSSDCDPFNPASCPLDTWVYLLAAIAIIFTCHHLQKQKKSFLTP